jgi:osomolarity two-component system response regulator SKN7
MDLVNTQLVATQTQLRHLEERYNELSMHHSMLLQELIGVQKTVVNHEHVMQNVMNFLHSVDAKNRRDSRIVDPFRQQDASQNPPNPEPVPQMDDAPASPLANAAKLLNEFNADVQLNYKNLEHMNEMHNRTLTITTPPPDRANGRAPGSAASSSSMAYAKLNDLDNTVYPVGQTNGIDPMYSEHVNNIPYPMPPKEARPDPRQQFAENRKKSTQVDPGWVRPPQILLVEDDPTCRRIGSKFLYSFHCSIDSAVSPDLPVATCHADPRSSTDSKLSTS